VHASQDLREKSADAETGPEDGIKVLSISGSSSSPMPAKKVAAAGVTYAVGEKAQALWTDGKWYDVVIKKIVSETKYQISQSHAQAQCTSHEQHCAVRLACRCACWTLRWEASRVPSGRPLRPVDGIGSHLFLLFLA
jgi:hypothetical protein